MSVIRIVGCINRYSVCVSVFPITHLYVHRRSLLSMFIRYIHFLSAYRMISITSSLHLLFSMIGGHVGAHRGAHFAPCSTRRPFRPLFNAAPISIQVGVPVHLVNRSLKCEIPHPHEMPSFTFTSTDPLLFSPHGNNT
jgi:hypothetical protein